MTRAFKLKPRHWDFLNRPAAYVQGHGDGDSEGPSGWRPEPLKRQFKTAKAILKRFVDGRGVLLADDAGLGKTRVAALVAWAVALSGLRVRIYAPNKLMCRRWEEELARHIAPLSELGARESSIKKAKQKLLAGCIQVATHSHLLKSQRAQRKVPCDVTIIDEAHRAKGEHSAFSQVVRGLGAGSGRKLILTATPFSIQIRELKKLLMFVGAPDVSAVVRYAEAMQRLYSLEDSPGDSRKVENEAERLTLAARDAIAALKPYLIRHGIDTLGAEHKHFGRIDDKNAWNIATPAATDEELGLLLRMDRLLHLASKKKGERRNDPRFHIGWQQLATELWHVQAALAQRPNRPARRGDPSGEVENAIARRHSKAATHVLKARRQTPHPKVGAVTRAVGQLLSQNEKVVVFCRHHATAAELLCALERVLQTKGRRDNGPPRGVWLAAWRSLLLDDQDSQTRRCLVGAIIDWLCSPGIRWQVTGWLKKPAETSHALAKQLQRTPPLGTDCGSGSSIATAAHVLVRAVLDKHSRSTLAVVRRMAQNSADLRNRVSQFPGRLDDGHRVMGAWDAKPQEARPATLYSHTPDIVVALFNSPFGPQVLVTTDWLSEGVDLHSYCRHLIHYELDPSPIRTLQRNGRIRRVNSFAARTQRPIRHAYPTFARTRDEQAVTIMRQRIRVFGTLLGGVPPLDDDTSDAAQRFAEAVLRRAHDALERLNRSLCVVRSVD